MVDWEVVAASINIRHFDSFCAPILQLAEEVSA